MFAKTSFGCVLILILMTTVKVNGQANAGTDSSATSSSTLKLNSFIPGDYTYMNVDVLGNIYLITSGNRLLKLNNKRDSVGVFNDVKKYGNPSYIDVSNPMKILVYYKNFSTIVALDRFLVFRNNINLRNKNIFSVNAVATSYDNNFWIFDEQDYKIKKINEQGELLLESSDVRQLTDQAPIPTTIIDCDNQLYVYDINKGFYLFDYYGAFKNSIPFKDWQNVSVSKNIIYGFIGNELLTYQINSLQLKKYSFPETVSDFISIKAINGKLYILKKGELQIYDIL
jgi:hypothetical protein